jgi:dTDP-glucose 4,6-dehydratase
MAEQNVLSPSRAYFLPGGRAAWGQRELGQMERRRAAVTGGAGFLGSHLCDRLLEEGYGVVCLDNFSTGNSSNVEHLLERDGFRLVRADVTEFVHVSGDLDAVLHFASPASPIDYLHLPIHTLKVGSIGTFHALGLAREKKARFLLASTSECYGDPLVHPQHERYWGNVNPVGPRGVYDEAKRFSEALTMAYRNTHGIDTAIVRIFNTFGPRMRPGDGRAIPTFIRQALSGQPLTVAGDGSQTRSVCYVDDLVEGVVRLLHSDLAGPMNIGNPQEFTILELAELIRDLAVSFSPIEFVPRPQDDPTVRQPDITFARTALSWEPAVDVKEGLLRTIGWFRRQETTNEFRSPAP